MTGFLLLALAAGLLLVGAELFVDNAAASAQRLGVSALAVGVLLAGAEPEELLTAAIAAAQQRPGLAAGDALGANVTMLTLTLGLAAVVRPLPVGRRVRWYAVVAAAAGGLALLTVAGGRVSRGEGLLLVAAYAGLVAVVWRRERAPPAVGEVAELFDGGAGPGTTGPPAARPPGRGLPLALAGIAVMAAGGNAAVAGAVRVVRALEVTDDAVGLTFLALATTAELFALVAAAARRGVAELAVAGVVGSALYNATATLGVAALVRPLDVPRLAVPAALAALAPLAVVALARRGRLGRRGGALLVTAYAVFVALALT